MGFIIIYNDSLNPKLYVYVYMKTRNEKHPLPSDHGRDFQGNNF